jgi:DNA mismatch repair ATPase MutS
MHSRPAHGHTAHMITSVCCALQFVDESEPQRLEIVEGKHPMLDLALDGAAVSNSLYLSWQGTRAAVITG